LSLDAPTGSLDPISAASFDELVSYLHRGLKLTIVMITHDLDTLLATCNRVAVLIDRKIVVDTLDGIMKNPHPWIQEYFHRPRARAAHARVEKGREHERHYGARSQLRSRRRLHPAGRGDGRRLRALVRG